MDSIKSKVFTKQNDFQMPPKREILMIGTLMKPKNNSKLNLYLTETHLFIISVIVRK